MTRRRMTPHLPQTLATIAAMVSGQVAAALLTGGALLAAGSAAAQERDPASVIVVTGTGLPDTPAAPAYATVIIERGAIITASSGRLEDVLGNVAGFQQFRRSDSRSANPSAQGATLRALGGNAASRALVLLDGVPMGDPFFGYIPYSALAPDRIAAVQVTRGGGAGPFGAGALAGTIRLESAGPDLLGKGIASALINHRGESEFSAAIAPQLGDGHAVLSGRWDRGRGFFTTPADERVPASARAQFDSWSVSGRVVHPLGNDVEVQLSGLAFQDDRTLRFEGADSAIRGEDIAVRLVGRGDWQFEALAYGQWRNFSNVVISSTRFTRVLDQRDTPASGFGGKVEVRPPLDDAHVLRLGADFRQGEGELFEDAFSAFSGALTESRNGGGATSDLGLYLEHDWQLSTALTLTGGLRADRYWIRDSFFQVVNAGGTVLSDNRFADRADWQGSWRGGALWQASEAVQLRAAAYRGFRLPTVNELVRPFVVFPVVTQANAALEPERLEGFELGTDVRFGKGASLSLTAFDNRLRGAIANVTLAPNLRERRNLAAIEAQGIEAELQLARGPFALDGSATYTDARVSDGGAAAALDGNRPPQVPRFSANLRGSYRCECGALAAVTLRHVARQFESDQESDVLPAATTLDLYLEAPLGGRWAAVGRVENAFDEAIVTRNSGGSIDLGAPRTVWLGVRLGY